jgi:copper chaperone CopZ
MNTTTSTTRTLEIDGMTGDTCVKKVTGALHEVQDVATHSVKVGSATIGADQKGCDAACGAIGKAGFKAREGTHDSAAQHNASKNPAATAYGNKPDSLTGNPTLKQPGNQSGNQSGNLTGNQSNTKPASQTEDKPSNRTADMPSSQPGDRPPTHTTPATPTAPLMPAPAVTAKA